MQVHSLTNSLTLSLSFSCVIGETWQDKVKRIRGKMTEENCSVLVATALDEVACKSHNSHMT